MTPEMSLLKFYSYGLVAKDKERGSNQIEVRPCEVSFSQQGFLESTIEIDKVDHDIRGGKDFIAIPISNSIPATWIDFNGNRITAPDVKQRELVLIWRLGETDVFFWQDRNVANVKRLETVVWAFSADPSNPMKPDLSNAYYLMISSHDKHITLQTSKENGEFCRFTQQINTADGVIITTDDIGNKQWFDSKNTEMGWYNIDASTFVMKKKTLYGYAKDSIKFKSKFVGFECDIFDIQTDTYKATAKSSYTVDTKSYTCKASSSWSVTSANASITAPLIGLNGSVSIGGGGGSSARSGGVSCKITADSMDFNVNSFVVNAPTISLNGKVTATDLFATKFAHGGPPCC